MAGIDLKNVANTELFAEVKRRFECSFKPQRRVVLVGPPGSGKGTQAPKLAQENCWCYLATGDLLRAEVARGSELGLRAQDTMNKGGLVSDDIVVGMIQGKMNEPSCARGAIFDGFPRTVAQAEALDKILTDAGGAVDNAVEFCIEDTVLEERITGRRVHKPSGRVYHIKFNPPKNEGKDDVTGETLIQRADDTVEVLRDRLEYYHSFTTPVMEYYSQRGITSKVEADQPIDSVWTDLIAKFTN